MPLRGSITGFGYGRWQNGSPYYNNQGKAQWAACIDGSAGEDRLLDVVCDNQNNAYVGGINNFITGGTPVYDASGNTQRLTNFRINTLSGTTANIVKYNTNGNCQWAATIDGTGIQLVFSLAYDRMSNIYCIGTSTDPCGTYDASGFTQRATAGYSFSFGGARVSFFAKINTNGIFQWLTGIPSITTSEGTNCQVDNNGNIYFGGFYRLNGTGTQVLYDVSGNTQKASTYTIPQTSGTNWQFLIKYNASGQALWSVYNSRFLLNDGTLGGLATDNINNVYFCVTYSSGAPYTIIDASGTSQSNSLFTLAAPLGLGAGLIKYNSSGKTQWVVNLDTANNDESRDVAVDSQSNIYWLGTFRTNTATVTVRDASGTTQSNTNFTIAGGQTTADTSAFLIKYNQDGKAQWATKIEQRNATGDIAYDINIDKLNNLYITGVLGVTTVCDFYDASGFTQVKSAVSISPGNSNTAGFLAKYNSNGICQWATYINSSGNDYTWGLGFDNSNSIYMCGGAFGTVSVMDASGTTQSNSGITVLTTAAANQSGPLIKYR